MRTDPAQPSSAGPLADFECRYDPAGLSLDASAIGNPFLFTGRRWHPELQLYHYRTRFIDPRHGRFISRDTIGLYGDPANLGNPNAYVGNNPWSGTDPMGQWGWDGDWVETALNVITPYGFMSSEGRAARAAFCAEVADMAAEQASGMWEGAKVLAEGDGGMAWDQMIDDVAQPYYERIMMHHTEGANIEVAISSATGLGMMASDFVGTTRVMEAYDGLDYNTGGSLDGIERAQRGLVGVSQMAATGALIGHAASATNAAASRFAASTSDATVARSAGLATTRAGRGFTARVGAGRAGGGAARTVADGKITGYARHGINQAIGREGAGVKPGAILDAVKNPKQVIPQTGGRIKYVGQNATVVTNAKGKVITTWPHGSEGLRVPAGGN